MMQDRRKLIVIGHGAAGLAAAVSAAEHSRNRGLPVDITVLEKSREAEAGGNTRWSPSNMRLATDGLDGEFQAEVLSACGGRADLRYFRALAENGTATIKWLESHDLEFVRPVY